jgi:hypothetical protein
MQALAKLTRLEAKVLFLTTHETDRDVLPAIKAGATGYLLKDATQQELFRAVGAAARGESVISPSVATRLLGQVPRAGGHRRALTQRELEASSRSPEAPPTRWASATRLLGAGPGDRVGGPVRDLLSMRAPSVAGMCRRSPRGCDV